MLPVKDSPARATNFLARLLERIWLSEYLGRPTDRHEANNFCGDGVFFFEIDAETNEVSRRQTDLPPRGKEFPYSVWPFFCSPVRITHYPSDPAGKKMLVVQMVDFYGIEGILQRLTEVVLEGDIGRYRITIDRANEIRSELALRYPFLPVISLVGYPYLDTIASEGAPARSRLYERLRASSISRGEYRLRKVNSIAAIEIDVEVGFYPAWDHLKQ